MAKKVRVLNDNYDDQPKTNQKTINVVVDYCTRLNVREEPDANSKILFVIPSGTLLVCDRQVDTWLHVHVYDDEVRSGYVKANFVKEVG